MSKTTRPYNEIDDYIVAFSDEERQEYAAFLQHNHSIYQDDYEL
jgi:hypothetical protein